MLDMYTSKLEINSHSKYMAGMSTRKKLGQILEVDDKLTFKVHGRNEFIWFLPLDCVQC